MKSIRNLLLAVLGAGLLASPALADQQPHPQRQRDANRAFQGVRQGRAMPLPMLERRVLPSMGGADYLGPEINGDTYRLKFIQNGRVVWVDVDGQGRIVRRSKDK